MLNLIFRAIIFLTYVAKHVLHQNLCHFNIEAPLSLYKEGGKEYESSAVSSKSMIT